jgi:hypothetical protein
VIDDNNPGRDCIAVNIKELVDGKVRDLKEVIAARFDTVEQKIKLQFEASQLAISKSEIDVKARFASSNEIKDAMKDQAGTYATRAEVDGQIKIMRSDINMINEKHNSYYTKNEVDKLLSVVSAQSGKVSDRQWALAIGIILSLLGAIFAIMRGG